MIRLVGNYQLQAQVARARRCATVCAANGVPGSTSTSMRWLRPRRARCTSSIVSGVYFWHSTNH